MKQKAPKIPYSLFKHYVLRAPLLPVSQLFALTAQPTVSTDQLKAVCSHPVVNEALYLASHELHAELQKWLNGQLTNPKAQEKLKLSALKYLTRMSSRCTPFGLFAGCGLGQFNEATSINIAPPEQYRRHTRLDMNFLVALAQDLARHQLIRPQLKHYPNTSLYKAGSQVRYVEYTYVNSTRQHRIVAVDDSPYLQTILQAAQQGALLASLPPLLVSDDIGLAEATGFIDELVESQVLISELEPSVSGPEFIEQMLQTLAPLNNIDHIVATLKQIQGSLAAIDAQMGNQPQAYTQLAEALQALGTTYNPKFLFQADTVLTTQQNSLDQQLGPSLKKALLFLNRITPKPKNTKLAQFRQAFTERYEEREVPLAKVLDTEIGIGYDQDKATGDVSPLVDDLALGSALAEKGPVAYDLPWATFNGLLLSRLNNALASQAYTLTLTDADVEGLEARWDDLPDTLSSMVELVQVNGQQMVVMGSASGTSAANLLGRFCHGDAALQQYTESITQAEAQMNTGKLMAEIVHLPESRVGNILMRPALRPYEIPYLAQSTLPQSQQLPLTDLLVSVQQHRKVVLRSAAHNKEVLPRLATAHNYSFNALPVYHFLCDMQAQDLRPGLAFSWGALESEYAFLPRVVYEQVILAPAQWNVKAEALKPLLARQDASEALLNEVKAWASAQNMPQYVVFVEGDNKLVVNLHNATSVQMWLTAAKKKDRITLHEFLHAEAGLVKRTDNPQVHYTNQVVVAFYNHEKLNKAQP